MNALRTTPYIIRRQGGAALMVMLVILIIGTAAFLIASLSKATFSIERDKTSSEILAKAKEAVIGYAVNNSSRPGDLPNPDRLVTPTENGGAPNYDGDQDLCPGLSGCLGRLPWRTLGMSIGSTSENDPSGIMPWYAVSANMVDPTGVTFNSELLNTDNTLHLPNNYPPAPHPWLTVRDMKGNILSDRVAFIVFIPGAVLPGKTRPASPLAGPSQYLDGFTVPPTCTAPCVQGIYSNADANEDFIMGDEHRWIDDPANPGKQIEDPNYQFNDKLLYVTIDELMPLIEKRIAREVKSCLDTYAASSAGKYPWAASVSDTVNYSGSFNTLFGRISNTPSNITTNDTTILNFLDALSQLQTALNTYNNLHNAANLAALINAGQNLKILADPAPSGIPSGVASAAENAGETAQDLSTPTPSNADLTNIQSSLSTANTGLSTASIIDGSMGSAWSCSLLTTSSNYWSNWKNLVYYQIASGYKPGTPVPACGSSCLSVYGSGNTNAGNGNYHAVVIVAGKKLGVQTRIPPSTNPPTDYLANNASEKSTDPLFVTNAHDNASLTQTFVTYKPSDAYYQSVNDLILCLDGKGLNPGSVCQ